MYMKASMILGILDFYILETHEISLVYLFRKTSLRQFSLNFRQALIQNITQAKAISPQAVSQEAYYPTEKT